MIFAIEVLKRVEALQRREALKRPEVRDHCVSSCPRSLEDPTHACFHVPQRPDSENVSSGTAIS